MKLLRLSATLGFIVFIACCGEILAADPIKCLKCDSTDPNCIADLTKITSEECATATPTCFTKVDTTGQVTRGCLADIDACDQPGCFKCVTAECNKHKVCKSCISSTDPDCAKTDSSKATLNSICQSEQIKCITNIKDQHVERRCATAEETCSNTTTCKLCDTPNCNIGIWPTSRLQCYQCNSADTKCANVDINSDSIKSLPCLLYNSSDECYTFGTSDTLMTRGCVSDVDTSINKCKEPLSNEACAHCSTANCNNRTYKRTQSQKCIQCDGNEDKLCMWGQKKDEAKNCKESILYNTEGGCYLQTLEDKSVQRGCIYDRTEALGECKPESCTACSDGDGCNSKDSGTFTCVRCRSDVDYTCRNNADKVNGTECRNDVMQDTSSCFTGIWNNVVIRGCLVDADERQTIVCSDAKNNQCKTCTEKDCNTNKTGGAAGLKLASSLLIIVLAFLWRLH